MFVLLPRYMILICLDFFEDNKEEFASKKYLDYFLFISLGVVGSKGLSKKPPLAESSNVRQFEGLFLPQENRLVICLLSMSTYFHAWFLFPQPLLPHCSTDDSCFL